MSSFMLPFEKPIKELETKLEELKSFQQEQNVDVSDEISSLEKKLQNTRVNVYGKMTAWEKVQLARHPQRPYTRDYIDSVFTDFIEIHGDRLFREDAAIVGGWAKLDGEKMMIIGTQKGRDTKSNLKCNFGCPYPEGYRKALRLMKMAAKFKRPIITFIDTAGAYPGLESEERHIAEAIALNLREMFTFGVPIIAIVIGEGGSGGALGIGVSNKIIMLENAYYSVISPEGCAAILWKDRAYADKAAEALKITSEHLKKVGLCDEIIPEPLGGAHHDAAAVSKNISDSIKANLAELNKLSPEELKQDRYEKFRAMGVFGE